MIKERETHKPQERQVMHNSVVHHLLTDAQPVPEHRSAGPSHLPPVYILSMTFIGVEYPFG